VYNRTLTNIDYNGLHLRDWTFCKAVARVRSTYSEWLNKYPFPGKLMRYWLEENIGTLVNKKSIPNYVPDNYDIDEVKR